MDKKIIEVFTVKEILNNKESKEGGNSCGCSCSCSSPQSLTINDLAERFSKKYASVGEFKIYNLTIDNKEEYISKINKVLLENGEKLIVNESNLDFILSKVAPLIVVNGKIISVKNYPDEDQLYEAIIKDKKISMRSGCC